jgi:hypothetical protein
LLSSSIVFFSRRIRAKGLLHAGIDERVVLPSRFWPVGLLFAKVVCFDVFWCATSSSPPSLILLVLMLLGRGFPLAAEAAQSANSISGGVAPLEQDERFCSSIIFSYSLLRRCLPSDGAQVEANDPAFPSNPLDADVRRFISYKLKAFTLISISGAMGFPFGFSGAGGLFSLSDVAVGVGDACRFHGRGDPAGEEKPL